MNGPSGVEAQLESQAVIWRRVPPAWIVNDENLGRRRPTSAAFDDHRDGTSMSMYIAGAGNTVDDVMKGHDGYALASVTFDQLSRKNLRVIHDPLPGFPSHVEVVGRKTKRIKSDLAKEAAWVVLPPQ